MIDDTVCKSTMECLLNPVLPLGIIRSIIPLTAEIIDIISRDKDTIALIHLIFTTPYKAFNNI